MTANEIIKALKCCTGYDCENCEALKYCDYMHPGALARASLDLINRQKAEIEGLEETRYELACIIDELLMCIDEGKETKSAKPIDINEIKSEAVKEFAERFAKELSEFDMSSVGFPDYDRWYKDCMTAIEDTIDSLVKEMTE